MIPVMNVKTMRSSVKQPVLRKRRRISLIANVRRHAYHYLLALPGIVFLIMFRIIPALGSVIAWQNYSIFGGILGSQWVGWQNFHDMIAYHDFTRILSNTLILGFLRVVFTFAPPIILALLITEVQNQRFKRVVQTLVYLPHFLSWVIVSQLVINILSPQGGLVNVALGRIFGTEPVFFMARESFFRPIFVSATIWKTSGFESIIYLASIAAIDPQLFDAAAIDGAGRMQQIWRITLPSIFPTIVILTLLRIGNFLNIGFDQIYTLSNPLTWGVADIFDTYVYRVGLLGGAYSLTTAVNLFKAVVGFVLLKGCDSLAQRLTGSSLFGVQSR